MHSLGQEAVDVLADAGLYLEPWQQNVLHYMAATREETYYNRVNDCIEHKWAAREFGFMLSRQNGKSVLLQARIIAGLFIWGEETIIHTAQLLPTALEVFNNVRGIIESTPELANQVEWIHNANGQEGIGLIPRGKQRKGQGSRVLFRARSKSAIRGFSPDCIIFDEAMLKLGSDEIKATKPAVSARPSPQLIFTGSAGDLDSEYFGRMRNRALNAEARPQKFMCWMEWSAKPCDAYCAPGCTDHDDPRSLETAAKANPALNLSDRLTTEDVEDELESLEPEDYARERLGVGDWPADGEGWRVIPRDKWTDQESPGSEIVTKYAMALDVAPDSKWSCIAIAGQNAKDEYHVEIENEDGQLYDYRPGVQWVVPRAVKLYRERKMKFIVIDPSTPAGDLIEQLEAQGVKVETVTPREMGQACGAFKSGIAPRGGEKPNIIHLAQAPLTTAVASADIRPLGDLWLWDKKESAAEITPLTTATLALFAYKKWLYKKRRNPIIVFDDEFEGEDYDPA